MKTDIRILKRWHRVAEHGEVGALNLPLGTENLTNKKKKHFQRHINTSPTQDGAWPRPITPDLVRTTEQKSLES